MNRTAFGTSSILGKGKQANEANVSGNFNNQDKDISFSKQLNPKESLLNLQTKSLVSANNLTSY